MRRRIRLFRTLCISLVVVSLAGCDHSSSGGQTAPSITAQPTSTTVTVGQTATFSVTASGTAPLTYQWRKNMTNISGATNASYTTPATVSGDSGAQFDVVVSNAKGSVTSSMATLTVNAAATLQSIAVTPSPASVTVGSTQQFKATGTYSDSSTKDITTSVTWASSNTGFATIGALTGLATGVAAGTTQITAMQGSITSPNDPLTVTAVAPPTLQSIAVTPASPSIVAGATQQFTATGTYSDSSTKNITTSVTWASSNTGFATIGASTGLATGVAAGTTQITAMQGSITSPNDPLTVTASTSSPSDNITYHYDNSRSGANTNEALLTTSNVNSTSFGKLGELTVDARVDGQILYVHQIAIPNEGTKNVIYFATENDSIYAVDADSFSGTTATVLWRVSVLPPGESAPRMTDISCGNVDPIGIMSTPVIDRGRNAIYVVALSKNGQGGFFYRIHALSLTTGKELFGGPTTITATYPGTGGNSSGGVVTFLPLIHEQRAALLESGGKIYIAFSGYYGDCNQYSAWLMAYDAGTLAQTAVIDLVPDNYGAGMWMGGGGPAADSSGNVYTITGNGFNPNTDIPGMGGNYPNSFIKLATSSGLSVSDYFAPSNTISEDAGDVDFGSAGPLLIPDQVDTNNVTQHLAIGAGKDGNMYVMSRDNLGQYNSTQNNNYQVLHIASAENFSSPVYFNGTVYIGPGGVGGVSAYTFSKAKLPSSPTQQTSNSLCAGTTVSVSANGTSNGIVWCVDFRVPVLRAFDATHLSQELYDSTQASSNRDAFSAIPGHFITPMVGNGKVYFGTGSTVAAFGLLP